MKGVDIMQSGIEKFDKVMEFLETGWEIQEPVFSQFIRQTRDTLYHFRLRNPDMGQTAVFIVPTSRSLQQFFVKYNIDTSDISWRATTEV
jgi:hypothetical protein